MTSTRHTAPRRLGTLFSFIKVEHTLFALPFAYSGMLLAAGGWPGWRVFVLVTIAMVGARTCAMAANRVIDARIDALNPRTAGREIPSGRLSSRDGLVVAAAGLALLVYAGASLNPLTLLLLPIAVVFLIVYPYTKRFTWACHLWLGATIGAAAAGGFIAVAGAFEPVAWLLWLAVGAWVAGFDVLYGVLDVEFDTANGVHSIPADLGIDGAIRATAALYVTAVVALAAVWAASGTAPGGRLAWPFLAGVALVALMLGEQHRQLRTHKDARVLEAFNANMIVGPVMLVGTVLGLALR